MHLLHLPDLNGENDKNKHTFTFLFLHRPHPVLDFRCGFRVDEPIGSESRRSPVCERRKVDGRCLAHGPMSGNDGPAV